jgi:UDP-GlcNAc3NAcA epimerase
MILEGNPMKLVTVVGARPQFIKAAMLSKEIAKDDAVEEVIVHTGQHFDSNMSEVFFDEMGIPKPKYFLDINSLSHGAMTGRMLEEIEKILIEEKPDMIVLYGDTNSTLAGALAAVKLRVPVAHIEAGVRSGYYMPEEVNRVLTDQVSDLLFTPSQIASDNLAKTDIDNAKVHFVGDIMFDAICHFKPQLPIPEENAKPSIYVTVHRENNIDNVANLKTIVGQMIELAKDYDIVWPLHPRAKKQLERQGMFDQLNDAVTLIGPQPYLTSLGYLNQATGVITDSGGMQKEAYYFGKPTITLLENMFWPELLETGLVKMLDAQSYGALAQTMKIHIDEAKANADFNPYVYGKGNAAELILGEIKSFQK